MNITRRQFVRLCGGTAAVVLPFGLTRCAGPPRPAHELIDDVEWKKGFADAALRVANSRGATFADVRVVRNIIQTIAADDQQIKGVPGEWHYGSSPEHVLEKVDIGFNVRVLKDGAWGFVASPMLSEDEAVAVAGLACDLAEKAARTISEPIRLVPEPVHVDTYVTPHQEDPFAVPLDEKVALLLRINEEVRKNPQTDRAFSWLDFWDENKFYANSEGAEIQQRLVRSDGSFFARAQVDGVTAQRRFFVNPLNIGYEYIRGLDLPGHAERIAAEAVEKAKAPMIDIEGEMDVVMDPQNICLFEHETVGHPTELNRTVLVETNFAGTTFLAPEDMGTYEFGSPVMNFVADRSRPMLRSTCGYDDEGVKTQAWDVVREGKLVGFQTTREFATYVGEDRSRGCCMTESWDRVPQGRMPNVSLEPGGQDAPHPKNSSPTPGAGFFFPGSRAGSFRTTSGATTPTRRTPSGRSKTAGRPGCSGARTTTGRTRVNSGTGWRRSRTPRPGSRQRSIRTTSGSRPSATTTPTGRRGPGSGTYKWEGRPYDPYRDGSRRNFRHRVRGGLRRRGRTLDGVVPRGEPGGRLRPHQGHPLLEQLHPGRHRG